MSLAEAVAPRPRRAVDVCLAYLKAEGARIVFGVPGGLLHYFFEAIEADPELQLIVAKHEEGAAFMADGFARVSGRLGVVAATSGPGTTNLLTGVACAYADSIPLLVITGQAALTSLGKGAAQEASREDLDVVGMFAQVTKYSAMVTSADRLGHHLRRALRAAHAGRPGPVHLNVPIDLWQQEIVEDWFDPETYRPRTPIFDRGAVDRAADLLIKASHPVLLAGSGAVIAGAGEHLQALAEMLPARVATTPPAKGVFPEDHPLSLGVLGFGGHRAARDTLLGAQKDVLLTVGASLNEPTTFNWDPRLRPAQALLQIDIDVDRIGRNYPVDLALVGDAQTILVEILYHLHRRIRGGLRPASRWPLEPPLPSGEAFYDEPELRASTRLPLTPQRWRKELGELLPDDAVVFSDIGGHMFFNLHNLRIGRGQRFVINFGFAAMGHGVAAPLGAALACSRPIIAITGDACLTMNGMELLTAVEYDLPVVWIVENNQMHGIIWHGSQLVGSRRPMRAARYARPLEIAPLARAMGLRSWRVDRPGQLEAAMREALAARGPCLIEVVVDPEVPPPLGDRARSIAGFQRD